MNHGSSFDLKALFLLALAGACSAALSVCAPLFLPLNLNNDAFFYCYKGFFFGVSLAIYFLLYGKLRSFPRAIVFIVSCMLADWASIATALSFFAPPRPDGPGMPDPNALLPFFAAGFVGSFLVCIAALLLYAARPLRAETLVIALVAAVVGGFLGVVGCMADTLSAVQASFAALFAIWQIGVAVMVGVLLHWPNPFSAGTSAANQPATPSR